MQEMPTDPRRAIFTLRIIWLALILGQAIFFVVAVVQRGRLSGKGSEMLPYIALALAAAVMPIGGFLRRMSIERGKREMHPMQGLATGTILFLACCEGPSFFASVSILITGTLTPAVWVPVVATALMLIVFPNEEQLV
jgi:hypothetical protein